MGILKKSLKIKFINPNTEDQIVQTIAGYIAYNLAENEEKIVFNYDNGNCQNSHIQEDELEIDV